MLPSTSIMNSRRTFSSSFPLVLRSGAPPTGWAMSCKPARASHCLAKKRRHQPMPARQRLRQTRQQKPGPGSHSAAFSSSGTETFFGVYARQLTDKVSVLRRQRETSPRHLASRFELRGVMCDRPRSVHTGGYSGCSIWVQGPASSGYRCKAGHQDENEETKQAFGARQQSASSVVPCNDGSAS